PRGGPGCVLRARRGPARRVPDRGRRPHRRGHAGGASHLMSELIALAKSARLVSDAGGPSPSPPGVAGRRRMAFAIGTSALVHVAIVVAAILLVRPLPVT